MPAKKTDDAFQGEAQRIITALEKGRPEEVAGEFDLPKYKDYADHEEWRNESEDQFWRKEQSRSVLIVAATQAEVDKRLPAEWKKLLQGEANG